MSVMETEQLARLVDRYGRALILYARQWCSSPEDVVQEAFVKLTGQRRVPDNVASWLYRVVRNGAISMGRAEQRRRKYETQAASRTEVWLLPSHDDSLDAVAVSAALQGLPLEEREILVAHIWGELTFEQIAELMGLSSSTAHRRYLAALANLRERLHPPCRTI